MIGKNEWRVIRKMFFLSNWLAWSRLRRKSGHFLGQTACHANQLLFSTNFYTVTQLYIKIKPAARTLEGHAFAGRKLCAHIRIRG